MPWSLAAPPFVDLPVASGLSADEVAAARRRVTLRRALRRQIMGLGLPASLQDGLRDQPLDALRATGQLLATREGLRGTS
jgi:hypothetical protein